MPKSSLLVLWVLSCAAGCSDTINQTIVYVGDCPAGHPGDSAAGDASSAADSAPDSLVDAATAADSFADTAQLQDVAATADAQAPDAPIPDTAGPDLAPADAAADVASADVAGATASWPAHVFAPYVDATLYPFLKLSEVAKQTGQRWFTLAFVVDKTGKACEASWGTYYSLAAGPDAWVDGKQQFLYDDLALLRKQYAGDVQVSLGGASSTPLEVACASVPALQAQLAAVVAAIKPARLDFDIEGAWLTETKPGQSGERRAKAIAALQADLQKAGTPLAVWFTLPVLPSGLTPDGLATVKQALALGVQLAGVNIMAMDYGDSAAPNPSGQMGKYAIDAATALHAQLATAYQQAGQPKTDAALWAMVGVTPMIGLNDVVTERFEIADAKQLLAFAKKTGLGELAMWSVNRDHPCASASSVQLTCSGALDQTADWQFTAEFASFGP